MKESTKHRKVFDQYVQLGSSRSLSKLCETLKVHPNVIGLSKGPSLSSIETWSSAFHWPDRIADLERKARLQDEEDQLKALRDMNERHIKEGLALQQKGLERLTKMPPDELPPSDAIRALLTGINVERLARGEPTDFIQQRGVFINGQIDLSGFSVEELRRLARRADRRASGDSQAKP